MTKGKKIKIAGTAGILAGLFSILITTGFALASPLGQDADPGEPLSPEECGECHLDVAEHWSRSPHANAYADPVFQDQWQGLGEPDECLVCHTTNFQASTGEFAAEGIECTGCHGEVLPDHPPAAVPIVADTQYCGSCHTTTLSEWRRTGHALSDVDCSDCHDPHSQDSLFENPDDLCINCHQDSMEAYLEDLHVQKGIGCVDCHALVIPPEEVPQDGIVPTGHSFTITPATCIACHTDALHAGFSLPGYSHPSEAEVAAEELPNLLSQAQEEDHLIAEGQLSEQQRVQALEASVASRNLATLFQGGIIGLVFGGSTAWLVFVNLRRREQQTDDGE